MNNKRGFEIVTEWKDKAISLPERKTIASAGYDIESAIDAVIEKGKMKIIPTGLKAYMGNDEYLSIHIRSSISIKKGIVLMNSTGITDADYYNNPENEGHIMIALYNTSETDFSVTKGERIAQGIFQKYLKIENDNSESTRKGGFGSTGK